MSKVIRRVWSFASLELAVQRQPSEPRLRRIAERPDRLPRVGAFAHVIAWARQRDHLPEEARRKFDEPFAIILRRAVALDAEGPAS